MDLHTLGGTHTALITYRYLTDAFTETYVAYDPTTPTFILRKPDGATATYTYPTNAQVTHPAAIVGRYQIIFIRDQLGIWEWEWKDPDPIHPGGAYGAFRVGPPLF